MPRMTMGRSQARVGVWCIARAGSAEGVGVIVMTIVVVGIVCVVTVAWYAPDGTGGREMEVELESLLLPSLGEVTVEKVVGVDDGTEGEADVVSGAGRQPV